MKRCRELREIPRLKIFTVQMPKDYDVTLQLRATRDFRAGFVF